MSKIYVFRCHNYMQLIALSHVLPDFLTEHSIVSENCTHLTPFQGGNLFVSKVFKLKKNTVFLFECVNEYFMFH